MKRVLSICLVVSLLFLLSCAEKSSSEHTSIQKDILYGNFDGKEEISLDELCKLSEKGDKLAFEDLAYTYKWVNFSNGDDYNMVFGVEGGYRLHVFANSDTTIRSAGLELIWESDVSVDIRNNDIKKFVREHPSSDALSNNEMKIIAEKHTKQDVIAADLDWWGYADEFPHDCKDLEKQKVRNMLDAMSEPLELFVCKNGDLVAVSRKSGDIYEWDGVRFAKEK